MRFIDQFHTIQFNNYLRAFSCQICYNNYLLWWQKWFTWIYLMLLLKDYHRNIQILLTKCEIWQRTCKVLLKNYDCQITVVEIVIAIKPIKWLKFLGVFPLIGLQSLFLKEEWGNYKILAELFQEVWALSVRLAAKFGE